MATLPYLIYKALQACVRRRLTQNQPAEKILIFFCQQPSVKVLPHRLQTEQAIFYERKQQQIQFTHAPPAVPRKFLVLNF